MSVTPLGAKSIAGQHAVGAHLDQMVPRRAQNAIDRARLCHGFVPTDIAVRVPPCIASWRVYCLLRCPSCVQRPCCVRHLGRSTSSLNDGTAPSSLGSGTAHGMLPARLPALGLPRAGGPARRTLPACQGRRHRSRSRGCPSLRLASFSVSLTGGVVSVRWLEPRGRRQRRPRLQPPLASIWASNCAAPVRSRWQQAAISDTILCTLYHICCATPVTWTEAARRPARR